MLVVALVCLGQAGCAWPVGYGGYVHKHFHKHEGMKRRHSHKHRHGLPGGHLDSPDGGRTKDHKKWADHGSGTFAMGGPRRPADEIFLVTASPGQISARRRRQRRNSERMHEAGLRPDDHLPGSHEHAHWHGPHVSWDTHKRKFRHWHRHTHKRRVADHSHDHGHYGQFLAPWRTLGDPERPCEKHEVGEPVPEQSKKKKKKKKRTGVRSSR